MSDEKEAKILFLDDLHDTKVADFSKLEGIGKQWYENCVGRSNFTVLGGTVMSKGEMPTKKELYEIYKSQGGKKPLEELKNSEWTMLSVIYYLEKAKGKENENG